MYPIIENVLLKSGPNLSSHIAKVLMKSGLKADAARKRISRANASIVRLKGVRFPNRETFLFLNSQFQTEEFRKNLSEAFETTRSSYGRALVGLKARGGLIYSVHFPIASGLPIHNTKGQLLHSIVEKKLLELELLSKNNSFDGEFISSWDSEALTNHRRAVMIVEDTLLSVMKVWLGKNGWASRDSIQTRSKTSLPTFGQFVWDLVGPTYLSGLINYQKDGKPLNGFIVGDIILDRTIRVEDLWPFFAKWDVLKAQRRSTRFQPIFMADSLSSKALRALRGRGTLVAMPSTIFGEEVAAQLKTLIRTIENAAAAVTNDPNSVFQLISKMTKLEGAALNLRGILLELIIGHLYKQDGYEIDIRQQIRVNENELAEIDIKAKNRREVVCCECKGKGPNVFVDKSEIEEWYDKKLPRIKAWLRESTTLPESRRFEFYSSTGFREDAKKLIKEIVLGNRKQPITFLNGEDVIKKLQVKRERSLVNIFREQFL